MCIVQIKKKTFLKVNFEDNEVTKTYHKIFETIYTNILLLTMN